MTRLCGWLGCVNGSAPHAIMERMGAACFGDDAGAARTLLGTAAGLSVSGGDLCRSGETLAAIAGHVEFRDARFAAIAQQRGMAAALIEAYAEADSAVAKQIGRAHV